MSDATRVAERFYDRGKQIAGLSNGIEGGFGNAISQSALMGLHILAPNEFEYYLCGLEVIDLNDEVIARFLFPVMPDQMVINKQKITNITKTANGVVVLTNPSFVPEDITISGSFGRSFKVQVNQSLAFDTINDLSKQGGNYRFDNIAHRGYGYVKALDKIYLESTMGSKNGVPLRLLFYNFAFSSTHYVEMINFQASQTMDSNMIWNYNLQMKAVAPKESGVDILAGKVKDTANKQSQRIKDIFK